MGFPVAPLGISMLAAAADGWVASMDATAGRTTLRSERTTWVQAGLVGLGVAGEFMDIHPDITEPLMFTGAALFARRLAFGLAQQGRAVPVPAQGMVRAFVPAAPQYAPAGLTHAGFGASSLSAAGYAVDQPTGSLA